jgi:hypothetical protein
MGPMITIDYHPVVEAVVVAWKKELPECRTALLVSEENLRELITRLVKLVELLATAREASGLVSRSLCDSAPGGSRPNR